MQTSNGNNAAPAVATLTVNTPTVIVAPTLSKAFSPATITAGGVSTLTITLTNPNSTAASLTAPIDTLPAGMVIAASPNAITSGISNGSKSLAMLTTPNACITSGGMTLTFNSGGSKVILSGGSIPAYGSVTVTVNVTASKGGNYINTLPAGALQTSNGNNAAPAVATLTVSAPLIAPTLSKAFSPTTITAGGVSTLTITMTNPNSTGLADATIIDRLPAVMRQPKPHTVGPANNGGSKSLAP